LLADDHHVVRTAVASFLRQEPDIEVVGEVGEASRLLPLVEEIRPDVLLLDAHMPGQNVIRTARDLCREHPELAILVLSAYDRREYVVGLLRAGASGYAPISSAYSAPGARATPAPRPPTARPAPASRGYHL